MRKNGSPNCKFCDGSAEYERCRDRVSKGKSMVSVLRPFGEVVAKPFEVRHTASELRGLADYQKSLDGETRVILEHTGRYYEPVAQMLHDAGVFVSAVNPKLIKD